MNWASDCDTKFSWCWSDCGKNYFDHSSRSGWGCPVWLRNIVVFVLKEIFDEGVSFSLLLVEQSSSTVDDYQIICASLVKFPNSDRGRCSVGHEFKVYKYAFVTKKPKYICYFKLKGKLDLKMFRIRFILPHRPQDWKSVYVPAPWLISRSSGGR